MTETPAERWDDVDGPELARRCAAPAVHLFATVGSTNDVARRLAGDGAGPGTVVLADEQRSGRGRAGRGWLSPPGVGLWFSVVAGAEVVLAELPLAVGLAVAEALDGFLAGDSVAIKWPNDLYIGPRKLGGILCEGSWEGTRRGAVVVGVGINLLQRPEDFPSWVRARATSLRAAGAPPFTRAEVAERVIAAVVRVVRTRVPLDIHALRRKDLLRGEEVRVRDPITGALLAAGRADGIAGDGALLVRDPGGAVHPVRSGTVEPGVRTPLAF